MIVALDAEAVTALAGSDARAKQKVRKNLRAAEQTRSDVVIPTIVLAELYRGTGRSQMIDAVLARHEHGIDLRDTDRTLARFVGAALHAAGLGSEHIVDADVGAAVVEGGGGVAVTGDPDDLAKLAAPYRSVVIEPI
jgi:predicted nucleic acid-binding protein